MPLATKRNGGRIAIVNLQATKQDKKAELKIHAYVDRVMKGVCDILGIVIPDWPGPSVRLQSEHTEKKENFKNVIVDKCLADCAENIKFELKPKTECGYQGNAIKQESEGSTGVSASNGDVSAGVLVCKTECGEPPRQLNSRESGSLGTKSGDQIDTAGTGDTGSSNNDRNHDGVVIIIDDDSQSEPTISKAETKSTEPVSATVEEQPVCSVSSRIKGSSIQPPQSATSEEIASAPCIPSGENISAQPASSVAATCVQSVSSNTATQSVVESPLQKEAVSVKSVSSGTPAQSVVKVPSQKEAESIQLVCSDTSTQSVVDPPLEKENESIPSVSSDTPTQSVVDPLSEKEAESIQSVSSDTHSMVKPPLEKETKSIQSVSSNTVTQSVGEPPSQKEAKSIQSVSSDKPTQPMVNPPSEKETESIQPVSWDTPTQPVVDPPSEKEVESIQSVSSDTATQSVVKVPSQEEAESIQSVSSDTPTQPVVKSPSQKEAESIESVSAEEKQDITQQPPAIVTADSPQSTKPMEPAPAEPEASSSQTVSKDVMETCVHLVNAVVAAKSVESVPTEIQDKSIHSISAEVKSESSVPSQEKTKSDSAEEIKKNQDTSEKSNNCTENTESLEGDTSDIKTSSSEEPMEHCSSSGHECMEITPKMPSVSEQVPCSQAETVHTAKPEATQPALSIPVDASSKSSIMNTDEHSSVNPSELIGSNNIVSHSNGLTDTHTDDCPVETKRLKTEWYTKMSISPDKRVFWQNGGIPMALHKTGNSSVLTMELLQS